MIILDTNILYYITEVVETKPHDMDIKELKEKIIRENVFISELSIIELCVHFMNDIDKIKHIFHELEELKIKIAAYPHKRNGDRKERLLPSNILEVERDEEEIRKLIGNALELRVEIESQFLLFWGINMATIYLGTKIYPDNKEFPEKIMNFMKENTLSMNKWIMGENNKLVGGIKSILKQYYKERPCINLKDKIQYFLIDICKCYFEMYYASLTGM
jgi:predicted nucleic acid-binding protein